MIASFDYLFFKYLHSIPSLGAYVPSYPFFQLLRPSSQHLILFYRS